MLAEYRANAVIRERRMKILTIIGARPQFIKAIALSHAVATISAMERPLSAIFAFSASTS